MKLIREYLQVLMSLVNDQIIMRVWQTDGSRVRFEGNKEAGTAADLA